MSTPAADPPAPTRNDFIRDIIEADRQSGKHGGRVLTRFPPEPNGYLHIGHAKSICLNFGIALEQHSRCNLRFDDTNPTKEDVEYVHAIERDVRWLGFDFGAVALYASDYFESMYQLAEQLIRDGKAYVDDASDEEIRTLRGSLSEPGRPSRWRDRSADESLDLFRRMRAGEFPDGARVLRARIDLAAANMKMRDPLLYRIRHAHHHRTGDAWCIYPMYDYAHPISDAIEGITHSICTLEFENNRELYDWVVAHCALAQIGVDFPSRPQQLEFARLNLDYTVMSKRKLLQLVEQKLVAGWDDPRMPTIAGMRRRGYSAAAIRAFCELIGVAKNNSTVDIGKLEFCVRDDLNQHAPRVMAVLRPLKVVITSFPDGDGETVQAPYFPPDIGKPGSRPVPLARELYIERDDFARHPDKDFRRLAPGRTVRLRYGCCITCDEVIEDPDTGEIILLRCSHLPETAGGKDPADVKVWGVIHWVSARHAVAAEVRLYDRLCAVPRPEDPGEGGGDFTKNIDKRSLEVVPQAWLEPSLAEAAPGSRWQFERLGYFVVDTVDSRPGAPVWNRIVGLRDVRPAAQAAVTATTRPPEPSAVRGDTASAKAKTRPAKRTKAENRAEARARDPELAARWQRYQDQLGLDADDADLVASDAATARLFEGAIAAGASAAAVARWLIQELPPALGDRAVESLPFGPAELAALVSLVESGTASGTVAKEIFVRMVEHGGDPRAIIREQKLEQVSDGAALAPLIDQILADHADKAAQYRGGKLGLLGFFVGQVVKASQGKANPQVVSDLLRSRLG